MQSIGGNEGCSQCAEYGWGGVEPGRPTAFSNSMILRLHFALHQDEALSPDQTGDTTSTPRQHQPISTSAISPLPHDLSPLDTQQFQGRQEPRELSTCPCLGKRLSQLGGEFFS